MLTTVLRNDAETDVDVDVEISDFDFDMPEFVPEDEVVIVCVSIFVDVTDAVVEAAPLMCSADDDIVEETESDATSSSWQNAGHGVLLSYGVVEPPPLAGAGVVVEFVQGATQRVALVILVPHTRNPSICRGKFMYDNGTGPYRQLLLRLSTARGSDDQSAGSVPRKLLLSRYKFPRLVMDVAQFSGNEPLRRLLCKYSVARLDMEPQFLGRGPLNWLLYNDNVSMVLMFPHWSGRVPVMLFMYNASKTRVVNDCQPVGSVPLMLFMPRYS